MAPPSDNEGSSSDQNSGKSTSSKSSTSNKRATKRVLASKRVTTKQVSSTSKQAVAPREAAQTTNKTTSMNAPASSTRPADSPSPASDQASPPQSSLSARDKPETTAKKASLGAQQGPGSPTSETNSDINDYRQALQSVQAGRADSWPANSVKSCAQTSSSALPGTDAASSFRSTLALGQLITANTPSAGNRMIAQELRSLTSAVKCEGRLIRKEIANLPDALANTLKTVLAEDREQSSERDRHSMFGRMTNRRFPIYRRPTRMLLQFARKSLGGTSSSTSSNQQPATSSSSRSSSSSSSNLPPQQSGPGSQPPSWRAQGNWRSTPVTPPTPPPPPPPTPPPPPLPPPPPMQSAVAGSPTGPDERLTPAARSILRPRQSATFSSGAMTSTPGTTSAGSTGSGTTTSTATSTTATATSTTVTINMSSSNQQPPQSGAQGSNNNNTQ